MFATQRQMRTMINMARTQAENRCMTIHMLMPIACLNVGVAKMQKANAHVNIILRR